MKSPLQKPLSGKWLRLIALAALLGLTVSSAQAEPPYAHLRPTAPGAIAIDWQHPYDGAASIILQREDPAFTWVFSEMFSTFLDLGLQPSHTYRYRLCAKYLGLTTERLDCTSWLAAQTLAPPPPDTPFDVPSFTSSSATTNSITVNWTSSQTYGFYQVRWAENGHGDGQNRVNGRSFTANGLHPGVYHFIVQGCYSGLFGSSCSRFSPPLEVTVRLPEPVAPPPLAPPKGVIYGITLNDDLMWMRHDGRNDGSFRWAPMPNGGMKVGIGWDFKQVFSGGDGIIYGVKDNGDLMWMRHDGRSDGSFRWAPMPDGGMKVGSGWNFKQVFSGGDGIIYGVKDNGDLMWMRHDGRGDGSSRWAPMPNGGKRVGAGWYKFRFRLLFSE